jgi:hypothetical protein
MKKQLILLTTFTVLAMPAELSLAATATMYVAPTGSDTAHWGCRDPNQPCATICHAIDELLNDGNFQDGVLHLAAGTYSERQCHAIEKDLTILGDRADTTTIDVEALTARATVLISDVTLGLVRGLFIVDNASVVVQSARFAGDYRFHVGAGDAMILSTVFEGRPTVLTDAGASLVLGQVTFENLSGPGALLINRGTMSIESSDIDSNQAFYFNNHGDLTLSGVRFRDNRTPVLANLGSARLLHCELSGNELDGGPLISSEGPLLIEDTSFSNNRTFLQGKAGLGIIFTKDSTLTVRRSRFALNYAQQGGAIHAAESTVIVENSTFNSNSSIGQGGGLFLRNSLGTISNSTFQQNNAFHSGSLPGSGGAIYLEQSYSGQAALALNQTTIALNTAGESGGGIAVRGSATLKLRNATIAQNRLTGAAATGAGISSDASSIVESKNSIVASNIMSATGATADCARAIQSAGFNLASDATCGLNAIGDRVSATPELGTIGNYGGTTFTVPLLGGPAVDRADPAGCSGIDHLGNPVTFAFDQRGGPIFKRHFDAGSGTQRCDMGAFEARAPIFED